MLLRALAALVIRAPLINERKSVYRDLGRRHRKRYLSLRADLYICGLHNFCLFLTTRLYILYHGAFIGGIVHVFPHVREIASFQSYMSRSLDNGTLVNLIFKYQIRHYRECYYRLGILLLISLLI